MNEEVCWEGGECKVEEEEEEKEEEEAGGGEFSREG